MSDSTPEGFVPPIIEAVLDIDCDMARTLDLPAIEKAATEAYADSYPKTQRQMVQEHTVEGVGKVPKLSVRHGIRALQFRQKDDKQLVQVRQQGFAFNRLAPYSILDDYLPDIQKAWSLFVRLAAPTQVRRIRLRYINRFLLPLTDGKVELNEYLKYGPQLPDEAKLTFVGFLNQHATIEAETGNLANIIMATQQAEAGRLPLIFDIEGIAQVSCEPTDWPAILSTIEALRSLTKRIFWNTVTDKCTNLCRP